MQNFTQFHCHFLPRPWDPKGIVDFSRTEDAGLGDLSTHTWWHTKSVGYVQKNTSSKHFTLATYMFSTNQWSTHLKMAIKSCEVTECWESTGLLIINGRPLDSPHLAYLPSLWWTRDHRHLLPFKEFSHNGIHKKQQMSWVNIELSKNILSWFATEYGIVLLAIRISHTHMIFLCAEFWTITRTNI